MSNQEMKDELSRLIRERQKIVDGGLDGFPDQPSKQRVYDYTIKAYGQIIKYTRKRIDKLSKGG